MNFLKIFMHLLSSGFIFKFANMVYPTDWFVYIEDFLHFWDKPYLIIVYDLF